MSFISPFTGDVIQPTDVSFRAVTLTTNTQLNWPSNSQTNSDFAARIMNVQATSAGLNLYMPPANQTSVGTDALIRNVGAVAFTVKTFGGNGTIVSIPAGQAQYIYITNNPDVYGTWGVIAFGIGSSSSDAAALAGLGLIAISTTLNQSHPSQSITNGYTYLAGDRAQTKVWSSGSGTSTLPLATSLGNNWFTLFKNNGSGTMTISTTGGDLLDGLVSKTFQPNESAFLVCTGTEYVTIGYGVNSSFAFTALVKPVTGGTYTLTTNEAQNTIQEYVGNLVANVIAVYPQVVTLYVISNQTVDNGFTLTVKTSAAGGNTVIIPPGQQATLVCDGTNFFNANTVQAGATSLNLVNGTVTTPAINFAAETNTGIWRNGAGEFDIAVLGVNRFALTATGLNIAGVGNFTGGVKGGTFP
jgi:hypothetical protein